MFVHAKIYEFNDQPQRKDCDCLITKGKKLCQYFFSFLCINYGEFY